MTASLAIFFITGYFGVGRSRDPAVARELVWRLDDWIPFVPQSVWIYLWILPSALLPLFVVRCTDLLRRTAVAYAVAIAVSLACFAVFPVSSAHLRAAPATLDPSKPSDWAVSILYSIDPPYNLFPSLHLSIAALAAMSAWRAARSYGIPASIAVGLVGVSVCTVKQHFVADALGGLAVAGAAGAVTLRRYRPRGNQVAYSWRGPALYFAFLFLVYTGFFVAYAASAASVLGNDALPTHVCNQVGNRLPEQRLPGAVAS